MSVATTKNSYKCKRCGDILSGIRKCKQCYDTQQLVVSGLLLVDRKRLEENSQFTDHNAQLKIKKKSKVLDANTNYGDPSTAVGMTERGVCRDDSIIMSREDYGQTGSSAHTKGK